MSVPDYQEDRADTRRWWAYTLLGAALIVLGLIAASNLAAMTLVSAIVFGVLLIVAGALEALHAFWARDWRGFLLSLLTGLVYIAAGWILLADPVRSSVILTLLFAVALIVSGIFRLVLAGRLWRHWGGLLLASGLVAIAAGIVILARWPASGLWVLGLVVAVDLVVHGAWWIAYSLDLRREQQQRQQFRPA